MLPVEAERIDSVDSDGKVADLGDGRVLEAIYAPGHAKHQMALLDPGREDLFVGDAIGVYLPDAGVIRPATPPPEFDLEVALETVERLRALKPLRMFPTHFGPVPDVDAAFTEGAERMRQWVTVAEEAVGAGGDVSAVARAFQERARIDYAQLTPELLEKFEQTTSYELNALGIVRYLTRRTSPA